MDILAYALHYIRFGRDSCAQVEAYFIQVGSYRGSNFVLGRSISGNSLLAPEILYSLERVSGLMSLIMILDMEHNNDHILWDFHKRVLRGYEFNDRLVFYQLLVV